MATTSCTREEGKAGAGKHCIDGHASSALLADGHVPEHAALLCRLLAALPCTGITTSPLLSLKCDGQ